jgi:signal transduction histidine kinase
MRTPVRVRGYAALQMRQIRFPGESPEYQRARALRERVDDLRDARQRIIDAADAERRRIQRDLHDGAQQRLVALALTLGLAEARLQTDPAGAIPLVAQAREEAQLAIKELRELAGGIHPTVLSDRGLDAALKALAARAPVPVRLSGVPAARLSPAVEAAAYFVTSEALANVAKYAQASEAFVRLSIERDCLRLQVSDDGVGGADPSAGTGLDGLRDRVDALDGHLEVSSPPGGGTIVAVEIPLEGGDREDGR